jgi:hypothetical protein
MYFNTTNLVNPDLEKEHRQTEKQDVIIYKYFCQVGTASPSQVAFGCGLNCPLTSIRRSITTLTKDGKIRKTTQQRKGIYGKPEYVWSIFVGQLDLL